MDQLWLEKYRPKKLEDVVGSQEEVERIQEWITKHQNRDLSVERFLLLYGSPGVGKTTIANIIFNQYDYDIVETNASIQRTKKKVKELLGTIGKYSVMYYDPSIRKKVGLIMEEIDGSISGDKNAINELINIFAKTKSDGQKILKIPIICTANNIKENKFNLLTKESLVIRIKKPTKESLVKLGQKIKKAEKIKITKKEIEALVSSSSKDYRTLINKLYQCKLDKKKTVKKEQTLEDKIQLIKNDLTDNNLSNMEYFLNNDIKDIKIVNHFLNENLQLYFLCLYQNYLDILNKNHFFRQIKNTKQKKEVDLSTIINISKNQINYDIYEHFKFTNQNWDIQNYISYIGVYPTIRQLKKQIKFPNQNYYLKHHLDINRHLQSKSSINKKYKDANSLNPSANLDNICISSIYNIDKLQNKKIKSSILNSSEKPIYKFINDKLKSS